MYQKVAKFRRAIYRNVSMVSNQGYITIELCTAYFAKKKPLKETFSSYTKTAKKVQKQRTKHIRATEKEIERKPIEHNKYEINFPNLITIPLMNKCFKK